MVKRAGSDGGGEVASKKRGSGYIGRRKEHKFEDVGDAKQRVIESLGSKVKVGGSAVVDDGSVWCPESWTVVTLTRGANDKAAGSVYHTWYAPDGAKYRSKKSVERRLEADAAMAALIASGSGDARSFAALAAVGASGDASTRRMEEQMVHAPTTDDPAVLSSRGPQKRSASMALQGSIDRECCSARVGCHETRLGPSCRRRERDPRPPPSVPTRTPSELRRSPEESTRGAEAWPKVRDVSHVLPRGPRSWPRRGRSFGTASWPWTSRISTRPPSTRLATARTGQGGTRGRHFYVSPWEESQREPRTNEPP